MRIGVLGTGGVAQTLAGAWSKAAHEVYLGSRDPGSKSLDLPVGSLDDVVAGAEVVVNATPGAVSLDTLNTAAMTVLTDPASLGPSSVFLSGNDSDAKATVGGLLADLGWAGDEIIDLGDITTARGVEHYFLLFVALMQLGGPKFNIRVVR